MPKFIKISIEKRQKGIGILVNCMLMVATLVGQNIVSDFSITDSEGSIHQLYNDYLDKEKIVVIDLFYADCPPCNSIAPFLKSSFERWGSNQKDVVFISLSPYDSNLKIEEFRNAHFFSHPFSGTEGGGSIALAQFTNGAFGPFYGYPVLLIIRPDRTVIYDIHSPHGDEEKIGLLDFHIARTIDENINKTALKVFPNPGHRNTNFSLEIEKEGAFDFEIYSSEGQRIMAKRLKFERKGRYDISSHFNVEDTGIYFFIVKENDVIIGSEKIIIQN